MAITPWFKVLHFGLDGLQDLLDAPCNPANKDLREFMMDLIIHRFEFATRVFWKTLNDELSREHDIDAGSPKDIFRECFKQGMINEEEAKRLIVMVDDRNDVAHEYEEQKAEIIAKKVQAYKDLMQEIADRLSQKNEN